MEHITDARGAVMSMDEAEFWKQCAYHMARSLAYCSKTLNATYYKDYSSLKKLPETYEEWLEDVKEHIKDFDYVQNKTR